MATIAEEIARDVAKRNARLAKKQPIATTTPKARDFDLAVQKAMREEFDMLEQRCKKLRCRFS